MKQSTCTYDIYGFQEDNRETLTKAFSNLINDECIPEKEELIKALPDDVIKDIRAELDKCYAGLSKRCTNVIDMLWRDVADSLYGMYERFSTPKYKSQIHRNIGVKTAVEFDRYKDKLISLFIAAKAKYDSVSIDDPNIVQYQQETRLYEFHRGVIYTAVENGLGFPLFKSIQLYIERDFYDWTIARNATHYYDYSPFDCEGNTLKNPYNLTVEQLSEKLHRKLVSHIKHCGKQYDMSHYKAFCDFTFDFTKIRTNEDVQFTDEFICFVLSVLFANGSARSHRYCILYNSTYNQRQMHFVPKLYNEVFDFDSFFRNIDDRLHKVNPKEYSIDLAVCVQAFFRQDVKHELIENLVYYLSTLLYEKDGLHTNDGQLIIPKNTDPKDDVYYESKVPSTKQDFFYCDVSASPLYKWWHIQ